MKKYLYILAIAVLIPFGIILAANDSVNVGVEVTGTCNSNGECESSLGENTYSCPADCGCNSNSICESKRGENSSNCADCVIVEPTQTAEGPGGNALQLLTPRIGNIKISQSFTGAEILWTTSQFALCNLYWGQTSEYTNEVLSETAYHKEHSQTLAGLLPSTVYHFKLSCKGETNLSDDSGDITFETLALLDNVSNFNALGQDKKVILSWDNPVTQGFEKVILLRSENFYPLNANNGAIIYEGADNYFIDSNLANGKQYFYTIFAAYKANNLSSGASASAKPYGAEVSEPVKPVDITEIPVKPAEEIKKDFKFLDFDFYSEGKKLQVKNSKTIEIENDKQIVVYIDSERLPKNAKTIIADLQAGENSYIYILKQDNFKDGFATTFISPKNIGKYPLILMVFDANNEKIRQVEGELAVSKNILPTVKYFFMINFQWLLWVVLLLLLIILFLLIRRRK